jgi:2'-5' RNA ligase
MTKTHRLFFTLEPGEKVRQEICTMQKGLEGSGRMIPASHLHITLAFLGQQPPEMIRELCTLASRLHFEPCTLVLDRLGTFRRASVLWLGATAIPDALRDFHQTLLLELEHAAVGFDRKAWKPHLTLYRRLRNRPVIMVTNPVRWRLNEFSLLESVNVKNGVEYHRLGCWKSGSSEI